MNTHLMNLRNAWRSLDFILDWIPDSPERNKQQKNKNISKMVYYGRGVSLKNRSVTHERGSKWEKEGVINDTRSTSNAWLKCPHPLDAACCLWPQRGPPGAVRWGRDPWGTRTQTREEEREKQNKAVWSSSNYINEHWRNKQYFLFDDCICEAA